MAEMNLESAAAWLNLYPEVKWDRLSRFDNIVRVFGWIRRSDGGSDFAMLDMEFDEHDKWAVSVLTSSAKYSDAFVKRLAPDADHCPCQRVGDIFGKRVPFKVQQYEAVMVTCQRCPEGALCVPNVGPMGDSQHTTIEDAEKSGQHWEWIEDLAGWLCASCRIAYANE